VHGVTSLMEGRIVAENWFPTLSLIVMGVDLYRDIGKGHVAERVLSVADAVVESMAEAEDRPLELSRRRICRQSWSRAFGARAPRL